MEGITERLVENRARLDSIDKDKQTPLSWAAGNGLRDIPAYLVDKGAQLEIPDITHLDLILIPIQTIEAHAPITVLSGTYLPIASNHEKA
jgi:ankyrin repeat protein